MHLDQRPPGGKTLRVDGGRGNALSRPGFSGDEHGHIRAGDLPDTFAQGAHGRAFSQQQIAGRRAALVFKIAVFQFQASLEAVQFCKTLGIGQRHGQIVGHKAQLLQGLRTLGAPAEHGQHAQHLPAIEEGLPQKVPDIFPRDPVGVCDPRHVGRHVADVKGFS